MNIDSMLNFSSGYESASNDSSLIESCLINQLLNVTNEQLIVIKDDRIDINYHHKKRRVLSRSQREQANRRERQRMDILNQAYENLQNVLPFKKGRKRQKMSRMDTVDGAIKYIQLLLDQLRRSTYYADLN